MMLVVDGLVKVYGEVVALDGCGFTAGAGRLTGFLGPNGAGKTTTMRAIFGLVMPDAGRISWDGAPVDRSARRRFGYMPEERGLYPKMRLREQVEHFGFVAGLSPAEAARSTGRWLERLGLAERGTATIDELSHGNQQRAQLAVALVHDPELLVLDEPFSGLDPLAVEDLGRMLTELAGEGRTVLFSSHQLDLVEDLCEDVVIVDEGRVVLAGELERLRDEAKRWHLTVEVDGVDTGWFRDVPGVRLLEQIDGRSRLSADRALDLGAIVAQAQAVGTIRRFDYDPPTLSQLFREAIGR